MYLLASDAVSQGRVLLHQVVQPRQAESFVLFCFVFSCVVHCHSLFVALGKTKIYIYIYIYIHRCICTYIRWKGLMKRVVRLAPWARTVLLPQEAGLRCGIVVILTKAEFAWITRRTWNIPPSSIISRPLPRILSNINVFLHFHICCKILQLFFDVSSELHNIHRSADRPSGRFPTNILSALRVCLEACLGCEPDLVRALLCLPGVAWGCLGFVGSEKNV